MEKDEIGKRFVNYIREKYYQTLLEAVRDGKPSLEIDFKNLDGFDTPLAEKLIYQPEETLKIFEQSVSQIDLPDKVELKFRFRNLPEFATIPIRHLRSHHIGQFISVEGIVRRSSEILPEISETIWTCPQCGSRIVIEQTERAMKKPLSCDCGYKGRFELFSKKLVDTRWIQIEEPFELTEGEKPSQLNIYLRDDLTSPAMRPKTDAGNRMKITGILREVPKVTQKGKKSVQLDILLAANHIETTETDYMDLKISPEDEEKIIAFSKDPDIYEKIIGSIATSTYGLAEIKEAIAYQLFSGVPHIMKDGTRIRGDIHILLVGEPSTGKSQLLKLVSRLANRGKYVSGKGVSVDYDDPIIYKEGDIIKTELIGKVCDRFYKGREEGFAGVTNLEVPAFDPATLKIGWKPVSHVFRHKYNEPVYKLILRTGREARVTHSHSIFTVEDNKIVPKKVEDIKIGDFVVIPAFIPQNDTTVQEFDLWKIFKNKIGDLELDGDFIKLKFSTRKIKRKIPVNRDLLRLIGYYTADGSVSEINGEHWTTIFDIDSRDIRTINDIKKIVSDLFGLDAKVYKKPHANCVDIEISNKLVLLFLRDILKVGTSAETKKIPDIVFNVNAELQTEFVKGFAVGDYGVTISKTLISDLLYLFLFNRTIASFSKRRIKRKVDFHDHASLVDREVYELKSPKIRNILNGIFNNSNLHTFVPIDLLKSDKFKNLKKSRYVRVSNSAKALLFSKHNDLLYQRLEILENGISADGLANTCSIGRKAARHYLNSLVKKSLAVKNYKNDTDVFHLSERGKNIIEEINSVKIMMNSDFGFVEVISIEKASPTKNFVYDLSVENCENFIAGFGGVMCHNTSVGLTAAVIKDEQFSGGWVLEAGAIVLANKGVCNIDEFEKMNESDQVALHEALEQQSYHPDTEIMLADGTKHKVGGLVERLFYKNKNKIVQGINCEILPTDELDILTTDFKDVYPTKVNRVSRHTAPKKFFRITFSNGRGILVTPEHPLFVIDGTKISTIPAERATAGLCVPAPSRLPIAVKDTELRGVERLHPNEKGIKTPSKITSELAAALGYYASEGHNFTGARSYEVGFTNTNPYIINDMISSMGNTFSVTPYIQTRKDGVSMIRYSSGQLLRFLKSNFAELLQKARKKSMPDMLMSSPQEARESFLTSAFLGDGFVDSERFGYCTTSVELAKGYQELLLSLGIYSYTTLDSSSDLYKTVVSSTDSMKTFLEKIVDANDSRKPKIEHFMKRSATHNRNHELPQSVAIAIKDVLSEFKLDDGYFYQSKTDGCGVTKSTAGKYAVMLKNKALGIKRSMETSGDPTILRKICGISQQAIQEKFGINHATVSYIERKNDHPRRKELVALIKSLANEKLTKTNNLVEDLKTLCNPNLKWLTVKSVESVPNENTEWVYDVTVEPTRSFISECLVLHNTVSVAKASIMATLPAQTAVLAAANPKFGRFDFMKSLGEQITIPETLLSRFDLKFALFDVPDIEKDTKMADHIMKSRTTDDYHAADPVIDPFLLRKYVAYARKNCFPKLTPEIGEIIKKFYIDTRAKYIQRGPISITPRQYEALIRLAEASAKIRLSPIVTEEDARRAIKILQTSLQQLGMDKETGLIDVDKIESGTSSSQRNKIRIILDAVDALTKEVGKIIPIEDVLSAAENEGITEVNAMEVIERLKKEGQLMEPKYKHLQKV